MGLFSKGLLGSFFGGKKAPPPPAIFGKAARQTESNADLLQGYVGSLDSIFGDYLKEYPEYQKKLRANYDRILSNLGKNDADHEYFRKSAFGIERQALEDLSTRGNKRDQNEAGLRARAEFGEAYDSMMMDRDLRESQSQTLSLTGRDSIINRSLAAGRIEDDARYRERTEGDNLRLGALGQLEPYKYSDTLNVDRQNDVIGAQRESFALTPVTNQYDALYGAVDNANSGWNSAVNSGQAHHESQLGQWAEEKRRKSEIFGKVGKVALGFATGGVSGALGGALGGSLGGGSQAGSGIGNFFGGSRDKSPQSGGSRNWGDFNSRSSFSNGRWDGRPSVWDRAGRF